MKAVTTRAGIVALVLLVHTAARAAEPARTGESGLRPPRKATVVTLLGLGAASAIATTFQDANETAGVLEKSPLEGVIDAGDWYGNGYLIVGGTVGLLALGHLTDHPRMSAFGADLAESLVMASGVVWTLKPTVNATRPDGGHHSFPSGHTAAAFSVAPVIAHHLGWKAGLGAYGLATVTALGRMEDRRHYLSDVLFGAAIGVASGLEVSRGNGLRAALSHLNLTGDHAAYTWNF